MQVRKAMLEDSLTACEFEGVYSIDRLPKELKNGIYIVNSSPSDIPVGHWIAIAKKFFFDSYGLPPEFYGLLPLQYNNAALQAPDSSLCGFYCILFSKIIARGYKLEEMIRYFTDSPHHNDRIMQKVAQGLKLNIL